MKENKYNYLTEYEIEQINKSSKDEILERLNEKEKKYKRLFWESQFFGSVKMIISKNGETLQNIELNEMDTENGFLFSDLKSISDEFQRLYQNYDSLIETKIILSDKWDERQEPKNNQE
mgnify:CR=1 FL=1